MILVPTIPHAGTHFMRDVLFAGMVQGTKGRVRVEHLTPSSCPTLVEMGRKAEGVVIPLRHPCEIALSWRRRGKDILGATGSATLGQWMSNMVEYFDPLDPHYLPLDTSERELYLRRMNFDLGLELETDWQPVRGEEYQQPAVLTQQEFGHILEAIGDHAEFWARFYSSRTGGAIELRV